MTTGGSASLAGRTDDEAIARLAVGAFASARRAIPDLDVIPQPGAAAVEFFDRATRLTFVAGLREPEQGDRRLAVWILPPKDRPLEGKAGLLQVSNLTLDEAIDDPNTAVAWLASALNSVRTATLRAIEKARLRHDAVVEAAERARLGAEAAERARAEEAKAKAAAARAVIQAQEAARAHEAAERRQAEAAAREERRIQALSLLSELCE